MSGAANAAYGRITHTVSGPNSIIDVPLGSLWPPSGNHWVISGPYWCLMVSKALSVNVK